MATVIDALLVTVGLDTSGYKRGEKEIDQSIDKTKERAQKGARDLEQSGKRGAQFFAGMRNEALKLAGALLSIRGIANFVSQITTADAATGRLAENIGMSAKELYEYEQIIQRFGGTAGQIDADFRSLNNTLTQWAITGQLPIPMLQALSQAQVDVSKFLDKATPLTDKFMMLARAYKQIAPTERGTFNNLLGLSESTGNMLAAGDEGLRKLIAEQRQLNTLSDEDVRLAKERQQAWFILTQKIEAAGRAVVNDLQEPLGVVLKLVGDIADKFPQFYRDTRTFVADRIEDVVNAGEAAKAAVKKIEIAKKPSDLPAALRPFATVGGFINKALGISGTVPAPSSSRRVSGQIGYPSEPAADGAVAPAPEASISKLAYSTQVIVRELLNLAKTNREYVEGALDSYKALLKPKEQAGFDVVMRRELGLYGAAASGSGASSVHIENNIGTIQINAPNATDARGIAGALRPTLHNDALARQANPGLR